MSKKCGACLHYGHFEDSTTLPCCSCSCQGFVEPNSCGAHLTYIPGWQGTLEDLANAVENMRYDKVAKFIFHLSRAFAARARRDRFSKRFQLGNQLLSSAQVLEKAANGVNKAWKICAPYMTYPATTGCCNVVLDSEDECCKCEAGDW